MGRKKHVPCDFREPCPRCGEPLAGGYSIGPTGTVVTWRCEEHGTMTDTTPTAAPRRCSLGVAWVLPYLALIDARAEILASRLPFWLDWEWEGLAAVDPAERQRAWRERSVAAVREYEDRINDPKRTIERGTKPAQENA